MPKLFSKTKPQKIQGVKIKADELYDFTDSYRREQSIRFLYDYMRQERDEQEKYWVRMRSYYDGIHDTTREIDSFVQSQGLPWTPAQSSDGFIHVETQIDPVIPEFEMSGRDDDFDNAKAKQREAVVRYVVENNPMEAMNNRNERRLNTYGNAAWKVAWDMSISKPGIEGDIVIGNPKPPQLFFDPSVTEDIDECEYMCLVYRMHKMKVQRTFNKDLKRIGKTIKDFNTGWGIEDTEFMKDISDNAELNSGIYDAQDETLQIKEFWFKQPYDGSETINGIKYTWEAGDIACSILINETEIKYLPKYWRNTNCKMYPFVFYAKVTNEECIYGKSELEMIKDFIDTSDRSLAYGQLNDAFMSNDIIIMPENALADDSQPENVPGAIWKTKASTPPGAIARLGNLSAAQKPIYDTVNLFREYMQQTTGNFDAFQGNEPQRVTTATGIAILNDRAKSRQEIKKSDRAAGFKRLFQLIDYTALEYYDDDRVIFLGAKNPTEQPKVFTYNSSKMRVFDDRTGDYYYPTVDVSVNVGDGLKRSKAFTIQALQELMKTPITPDNYKIAIAYLDEISIPQRTELKKWIEEKFAAVEQQEKINQEIQQNKPTLLPEDIMNELTEEERAAVEANPELLDSILGGTQ